MKNVEMANVSSYFRNVTIPSIASFHYTVGVTLLSLRQSQYRLYIDGVLQGNFTKSTTKSIQLNNDKNLTISLVMNNPKLNLGIYVTPMVSNATVNPVPELIHRNKDLSSFILQFNNSGSGILFVSESYSPGWEVDMNSSIHGKAEGFGNGFVFSTETAKQIKLFYREPFISFVLLFNFASFVLVVIVTLLLIIPTTNKLIYNIKAKLKVYMMRKISLFNSKMFRRTRR